jgi:hypothetical protein
MVSHTSARWLAVATAVAVAAPAAAAQAHRAGPAAHAAGDGAAPLNPAIVGVPMQRSEDALSDAAAAVAAGNGAQAVSPLAATRRYMIRTYSGAKYLIANAPPPVAEAGSASATRVKFVRLARAAVRASHRRAHLKGGWIHAKTSGAAPAGPAIADPPTAIFNVLTAQYDVATGAVGMAPDTKGDLLAKVKATLNTAIVLRNRLVKVIAKAAPPAPAEAGSVHAHASQAVAGEFDAVMPGLVVLIDDEIQQMQAAAADSATPAAVKDALTSAISADQQIESLVNQFWPPAPAEG